MIPRVTTGSVLPTARRPGIWAGVLLCSCLEPKLLSTGADIRDLFTRNMTEPVGLPLVFAQMRDAGTSLSIVLGPSIPAGVLSYPIPVVHVATPADVTAALTTANEFGTVPLGVVSS